MSGVVVIIAQDAAPDSAIWQQALDQSIHLQNFVARSFGVEARVEIACLPALSREDPHAAQLGQVIDRSIESDTSELFVLPATFELNVWQRTMLGEELSTARRRHPAIEMHHDSVDPAHPALVECFAGRILQALEERHIPPQQAGILLVADGRGDPVTRADAYRLMRLLWEQSAAGGGDVGFVRYPQPFLPTVLKRCLLEPRGWILVPHCQWDGELCDYASVMLADHQRAFPESADWCLLDPVRDDSAILAWLEQRLTRLWQEKRARQSVRVPSARYQKASPTGVWSEEAWLPVTEAALEPKTGILGRVRESAPLAELLERVLPPSDRYLVKVTWHGYAQGTYTGPAALDLLLSSLPGRAVVLEGHTSSRNVGGLDIEWESDAEKNRAWIRQQEVEFLQRTGLADVMSRHKAQYLNVTEAWWDGACAPAEEVQFALGNTRLDYPELAGFVPATLMELRGTPLISFARFKGPTRLGLSNLFGLIPHPLRTAWHGATITDFAGVCCNLARLYGSLFPLFGFVEAFDSAVRWDRQGLYRSRWGNYDLVLTDGLFTLSEGLVAADLLASRLQGQDVTRSGFYDVVREQLGWPQSLGERGLPGDLLANLA